MKQVTAGILAHVDAGKTTLTEAMLYTCGDIRKLGRVDRKDTFLDNHAQERERGITIFSKQASLTLENTRMLLLDTPGHMDFSAEMERTLPVLDYAILVISGSAGVQAHTDTLFGLLKRYGIPTFLFVNKMDQPDTDKEKLLLQLKEQLSDGCIDFSDRSRESFFEELAVCKEECLNEFLESGRLAVESIRELIRERKVFPCFFGSALKVDGIREFLEALDLFTAEKVYGREFGARVYKITRDAQGNRLTHMKITGGCLKARESLKGKLRLREEDRDSWEEKVHQIRVYSGEKFEVCSEVGAGSICAVTGLTKTWAGEGLGCEEKVVQPLLQPLLSYRLLLPEGCEASQLLPKLKQLEEEEPQLHILWDEQNKEMKAQIMGQVQTEVLKNIIRERFQVPVEFGTGTIVYKETIADVVEGVGHFEPLRHYAEVHLLLEPGERGSGITLASECSADELDVNWQRLILTHLQEKEHLGVLTGSPVTDIRITLVAGRAHQKHTEGGDFRQATYRALRQGLMQAQSVLLEPWYEFRLVLPKNAAGRAMADLERMKADFELEQKDAEVLLIKGMAPMSELQDYHKEVVAYTKGTGRLACSMKGYFPCHNAEEVIERIGYAPLRDTENTADSVFCAHGAGFVVDWERVPEYMHLPSCLKDNGKAEEREVFSDNRGSEDRKEIFLGTEEIDAILRNATHANRKELRASVKEGYQRKRLRESGADTERTTRVYSPGVKKEQYLLVDGYNVIFAWEELKELSKVSLSGARGKLLDILCDYQAITGYQLIVVFDAYRLSGHPTETLDYHNIHVVYTKEAETADRYIERFAHENAKKYDVTVATSDGMEQVIIVGEGCRLLSSRELQTEVQRVCTEFLEDYQSSNREGSTTLQYVLPM